MRPSQLACRFHLPMGTLLLLMAVVGWGLQYKTARYARDASHRVSSAVPATFLNDGERTLISNAALQSRGSGLPVGLTSFNVYAAGDHPELLLFKGGLIPVPPVPTRKHGLSRQSSFRAPPAMLAAFA